MSLEEVLQNNQLANRHRDDLATKHQRQARQLLTSATPDAARTLVAICNDTEAEDRDRISAAKDILDRSGVGKQHESASLSQIPAQFLTAALAGIAAMAGRNMETFGDLTNLQDQLQQINVTASATAATAPEPFDLATYAPPADTTAQQLHVPLPAAAAAIIVPRNVAHRRRQQEQSTV